MEAGISEKLNKISLFFFKLLKITNYVKLTNSVTQFYLILSKIIKGRVLADF